MGLPQHATRFGSADSRYLCCVPGSMRGYWLMLAKHGQQQRTFKITIVPEIGREGARRKSGEANDIMFEGQSMDRASDASLLHLLR
ncbi:hypothetical protein PHISCL_10384 [Aspergillus sclerotialis]|uniref:Uncharacterized protein n=1 Tax=Aspergillus sclerotialis TaxID=2070753 RepID=A0A3A2Z2M7_9EURO|nr:hypothetical protein PHISCL_10384 [Aspergillus sclerotialis]